MRSQANKVTKLVTAESAAKYLDLTNLSLKLFRALAIAALAFVFVANSACSSKKRIRPEETKQHISIKPQGKFNSYSKSQMKKLKLRTSDFESNAFENKNSAIDQRVVGGTGEVRESRYLLPDGEMFSWETEVLIGDHSKDDISILYKGSLTDIASKKKVGLLSTVECKAKRTNLASGVTVNELECGALDLSSLLEKELDIEPTDCSIKPLGHKPVTKKAQYGKYITAQDKFTYKKSVREEMSILGDIICNGENLGMGREERVTIYTHESPNTTYPTVGSAKQLFQSRVIKKTNGSIVYQASDELLENLHVAGRSQRMAAK